MQLNELLTSQEGMDLMEFVNFQVERGIALAKEKGHRYYVYSLEFKTDEQRDNGYIAMPIVNDYSSSSLEDVKSYTSTWRVRKCFDVQDELVKIIELS